MKKLFIPLVLMCLGMVPVKAENTDVSAIDNVVYLNPVTASAGTQCVLSIQMKNVEAIAGYEFYLTLPEGVSFAKDEDDLLLTALSEARTTSKKTTFFESTVNDAGLLHVLCSTTKEDPSTGNLYTFTGTEGEVCTIPINIPSDFEAGSYPIVLTEIVLTEPDTKKYYETARVETTLTVEANDGRLHFDENSTSLPTYTAGEKANVTMIRTIKANQWSTIVLPFTLTKVKAETVFGSDVQLAEFSGFNVEYTDEEDLTPDAIIINLSNYVMTAKKGMTGGKPYIIKTSQDIESIEADEVTLTGTVTDVEKSDEYDTPGKFTGSFVKTMIPTDGLFINDNKFWYSVGNTHVKAFRCWFELGAILDKETDFGAPVFFSFDNEVTGINSIETGYGIDGYYNLNGQRVMSPKKGLYIKNNKKVIVK